MLRLIENEEKVQTEVRSVLDELVREGAPKMLKAPLQYEVDEYVAKFEEEKDVENRRISPKSRSKISKKCMKTNILKR